MSKKYTIKEMRLFFRRCGCILLEKTYINSHTLMNYRCSCGNVAKIRWNNFRCGQQCINCKKEKLKNINIGINNPNWKGGKFIDKDGYVKVRVYNHPFTDSRGYIYEHRLVLEKKLGRYLELTETTHHKNGIRTDNRPENLEVCLNNEVHLQTFHKDRKW